MRIRLAFSLIGALLVLIGTLTVIWPPASGRLLPVAALLVGGVVLLAAFVFRGQTAERTESDDITMLGPERRRELFRGTSLSLREMRYRYSVRLDVHETADRRAFTAEVNAIHLGFLPAIVIDNTTDRQGYGYVAFVHDGTRWRGPGLPCPADEAEAVRHAARCVSPLATEEETRFGEGTEGLRD
jgi:hypothetical protein